MCYSISNTINISTYQKRFNLEIVKAAELKPLYYVSAFSLPLIPVIANDNPKELQFFRWGLIPHWVKTPKDADRMRHQTFNARAETIFEKPSFEYAAKSNRCLIPVDGFYEWHTEGKEKYPFYITKKTKEPFALAGIWDSWTNKETGEELNTFSIITVKANPLLEKIHNIKKRMPVILERKDEQEWLNIKSNQQNIMNLMRPYPGDDINAYTISKLIVQRGTNTNVLESQTPFEYKKHIKI